MALDRAAAEAFLCAAQRPDGAWGYRPDGMAFVEPTALAVIALRARPETAPVRARALDWLERLQQVDGGLPAFVGDDQASWMTALAALALVGRPAGERALDWLVRLHQAQPVFRGDVERLRWAAGIDGRQRGWPWVSGDATWVEPTAWAVLALAVGGRREAPETRAGVDFLLDRAGPDGGWNIGNPYMLNKPMQSEVPFTAKALLALRAAGLGPAEPRVAAGLAFIARARPALVSAHSLAWADLALALWGGTIPSSPALDSLQRADGSFDGDVLVTALAILAVEGPAAFWVVPA